MNNIYVDELPKKCKDCPFSYIGYAYDFDEVRFCKLHKDHCMHWIALYNDKFNDCPLKLLKKELAEERKKTVQEIWKEFKQRLMNKTKDMPVMKVCNMINEILDQIEGASDDNK